MFCCVDQNLVCTVTPVACARFGAHAAPDTHDVYEQHEQPSVLTGSGLAHRIAFISTSFRKQTVAPFHPQHHEHIEKSEYV